MRKLLTLLLVFNLNFLISQPKEINYSNWLFGNKAGITFNTPDGNPIEIFTNIDTLKSNEGICTFSDDYGNVKLVSNSKRLVHFYDIYDYDKYETFEFNIEKFTSSTNSTIILPSLSNPNQFYIFIVGETAEGNYYNEFYYTIFDTSLNNGKGELVLDLKYLNEQVSEKLAVIYDYNYNWYWIVTTKYDLRNFYENDILFYKLDEYGLNETPKRINTGRRYHLIGDMKFSKSGKYLALNGYTSNNTEIFKFDYQNCEIENILNYNEKYSFDYFSGRYGLEFSKNEKYLYATSRKEINDTLYGFIEQFEIDENIDIAESRKIIIKDTLHFGNIKRGVNDKLYISTINTKYAPSPDKYNNKFNYMIVLDNINENDIDISSSTFKFSDNRFPILGIQTTPMILNEPTNFCTPDISVYLTDKEVMIGDEFCINGVYIPECEIETYLDSIVIYFEFDPRLLKFESASTDYEIIKLQDKFILKLKFDDMDFILNQENEFTFCFTALLGSSKVTVLEVTEEEQYNLTDFTNSTINMEACDQPYRQIKLIIQTDFEPILDENNLKINLSTEEQGKFEFLIIDVNGKVIKQEYFTTNKEEYRQEEILIINLEDLPAGNYFIRMIAPSGKFYTKQFVKV